MAARQFFPGVPQHPGEGVARLDQDSVGIQDVETVRGGGEKSPAVLPEFPRSPSIRPVSGSGVSSMGDGLSL